jgi:peptidoglycan/xylan/chitin deacetylase (PgdA/CDA1 family)
MREKKVWLGWAAAAALAAALGAVCLWQNGQRQAGAEREAELTALLAAGQSQLEELQTSLDDRQAQLDEAQETIAHMEEYSYVTPDGIAPEYTQLYPEMYAEPWEGETVTGEKTVCLTFDDGPSENTDEILKILDQYGIKATFFVVGKTGEENQRRMRDIVAAGHTLAVHGWSHDYKKIYASVEAYLEDFHQLYEWIYEVTGDYPQVFRFPGGSINAYNRGIYQEIIAEMTRRGFVYFDWNASAQDATAKPLAASVIASNCLKGVGKDLTVVLCHDSAARTTTVEALPAVIEGYQAAGYTFAALTPGVTPVMMEYKVER